MPRDYYVALGVSASAAAEDIHAAFRRRTQELETGNTPTAGGPLERIQEAFAVLSDRERRKRYDQSAGGPPRDAATEAPPAQHRDYSLSDAFEQYRPSHDEVFERLQGNYSGEDRPKAELPQSLTVEVLTTVDEASHGGHVRIGIPAQAACPVCRGRGAVANLACTRCGGAGTIVGEQWIDVAFPAGMRDGHIATVPLKQFGIRNLYLTVLFRVSAEATQ